jgi:hypothetical protein
MLRKTLSAVFAAMAVIGCNEKNLEVLEEAAGEKIQLTVKIPEEVTKVTGTPTDGKVNDLQVFVFDRNGVYETSSHGTGAVLAMTCTSGEKQVVALVNAPVENGVNNIEELRARTVDLKECAAGHIAMYGEATHLLTASASISLQVERIVSKVAVGKVETAFELDQHKALPFEIKAIYLVNAAGEKAYMDSNTSSLWYNKGQFIEETSPEFLHDYVTDGVVVEGTPYTNQHYFYCFPNYTTTKTRLVVEAQIGGYTYYYPITLNTLEPNTSYTYNLTITRLGSDSPDVPVEEGAVEFTMVVKRWTEQNVNEVI